jgi:glycosyltransferase involved in cell wall biosynthesis
MTAFLDAGSQPTRRPDISVVVCTYNRATKLPRSLEALSRQTVGERVEVIVVDDGSTDTTAQVARAYQVKLVRHATNRGLAAARNTGVQASNAPIVAFTDDDCVPARDWLELLLRAYERPGVLAVGGTVSPLETGNLLHRYIAAVNPLAPQEADLGRGYSIPYRAWLYAKRNVRLQNPTGPRPVYSIPGANLSARREVLGAIGLFDPGVRFGGEDEDLCTRLRQTFPNGELFFTPEAVVHHDYDRKVGDTLRRSFAYGKGSARNFLKHEHLAPTIYPLPVLVLGVASLVAFRRWSLGVAAALPLVASPRWIRLAWRRRSAEPLVYAYIQTLQEAAHDLGFAKAWLTLRKGRPTAYPPRQKPLAEAGTTR